MKGLENQFLCHYFIQFLCRHFIAGNGLKPVWEFDKEWLMIRPSYCPCHPMHSGTCNFLDSLRLIA